MASEEDITLYYTGFQESLRVRNLERAAGYLHILFININYHPSIISQIEFRNITAREYVRLLDIYIREFPDDPIGYLLLMSFHRDRGRVDLMREAWQRNCDNALKGFHFQPSISASVFDAEAGQTHTSIGGVGLGSDLRTEIAGIPGQAMRPTTSQTGPSHNGENDGTPSVVTEVGEPIGDDGVALNGVLSGFNIPTRYHFRFGADPDKLDQKTSERDVPAGRFGRVRDTGDNLFRRLTCYAAKISFMNNSDDDTGSSATTSKQAIRLEWPFGKDRNHLDGIGIIDLLLGWQTLAQSRGNVDGLAPQQHFPTLSYPGENIDLRDAKISIRYRSEDLNAKAFVPVAWIHSRSGTAAFPESYDDLTAWAYTDNAQPITFEGDGVWHEQNFELSGLSSRWTFSGSNIEEMGGGMARYNYAPIQNVQRDNVGGNVCIAFVHGEDLDTPEGSIDISHLEMSYRSRSLLGPGQGATLNSCPEGGENAASCLTDGTIGDIKRYWFAGLVVETPIDLIWQLRDTADIEAFKIYRSTIAPAKDLEIAVSSDGNSYEEVWAGTLGEMPNDPAQWGEFAQTGALAHAVVLKAPVSAQYVRLRIVTGYQPDMVGLDAFEVFGQGLPPVPSPAPFSFSEQAEELGDNDAVFAQLVAENAEGVFEGNIVEIRRPEANTPHFLSAGLEINRHGTLVFTARVIAMGSPAVLSGELVSGAGDKISIPLTSVGQWLVPRDVRISLGKVEPDDTYSGTCWAENETGRSKPVSVALETGED